MLSTFRYGSIRKKRPSRCCKDFAGHRVHSVPSTRTDDQDDEDGSLARTANPIGQLEDPNYLRKANALYYEFDEVASASKTRLRFSWAATEARWDEEEAERQAQSRRDYEASLT